MTSDNDPDQTQHPEPLCTQPQCMLHQPGTNSASLANLVLEILSNEDAADTVPEEMRIERFERCHGCVEKVLRDQSPYLTEAQHEELRKRLVETGARSYRRQRRHQ